MHYLSADNSNKMTAYLLAVPRQLRQEIDIVRARIPAARTLDGISFAANAVGTHRCSYVDGGARSMRVSRMIRPRVSSLAPPRLSGIVELPGSQAAYALPVFCQANLPEPRPPFFPASSHPARGNAAPCTAFRPRRLVIGSLSIDRPFRLMNCNRLSI